MTSEVQISTRTHDCGALRSDHIGHTVTLMGWVQNRRDHGGCVFVDLRDREGVTQVVFDPQMDQTAHEKAGNLRAEWVVAVSGEVRDRGGNTNPRLATGDIELAATRLHIFSSSETPPFQIEDHTEASEEVRLTYRYLDLRRPPLQRNLIRRHRFLQLTRQALDEQGFLELETPFLIRSTPEGARDYVVPSRVNAGKFFALPQSPQLFKQLFMVAGFDRYFQIVRCFRDEDLRAERQPEFTQVDIEMSFCRPSQVQAVVEGILAKTWRTVLGAEIATPFTRIRYQEAMDRFGVDAPDLRFGLELVDVSDQVRGSDVRVFSEAVKNGGIVKSINLRELGDVSRKQLDDSIEFVKIYGAKGMAWVKVKPDGTWQSPIAKFFRDEDKQAVGRRLDLKPGDVAVFVADRASIVNASLGQLRKHLARQHGLVDDNQHMFCWVTDFPLFEWDEESRRLYAAHHPFTSPHADDISKLDSDPRTVRALAYDIVLNGVEIGGGSIRIHDASLQKKMFAALGIEEKEAQDKFGFLLEALRYGAPPHGGIALGVDRIMMLLCGTPSIRDVIAFPKTQKQIDLMLQAPTELARTQLTELGIRTVVTPGAASS